MAADFTIKAHDRKPSIAATLTYEGGAPVILTGCTVKFIMRGKASAGSPKVNSPAVIVTATLGKVRYDWTADDTSLVGEYSAEWEVTDAEGLVQTFPTQTYHSISVLADLNEA